MKRPYAMSYAGAIGLAAGLALVQPIRGADEAQAPIDAVSPAAQSLSPFELVIWNDPVFKRRFIESYMAETEIEPRLTEDERERMIKILDHISKDETEKAVALLSKHEGPSASAVFDFTIANIYFQNALQAEDEERQALFESAAAAYLDATGKHAKFRRAWRNLAMCHLQLNQWDKALPALTTVVELGGGDALTYGLLGYAYSNVDNHLSAESAYRMANLFEPDTMDWKLGLARSFFKQERYGEAIALTNALLKEQPDNADFWLLQANAYIGLNQPQRAAENYEIVDRLGKSTPESLNMLADIYVNDGLNDLAVEAYMRAMEMKPDARPDRGLRAARVLVARGAYPETRTLLERIEAVHGTKLSETDRKDVLKLRARLAVAEGAGDEEASILEEIVTIDPLDGEALILLGQHSFKAGDHEKAIFYFERAKSLEKYESEACVRQAQVLVQQKK